jgi:hypothetical protein
MKHFTEYLQEMNRSYQFSIKLANCDFDKDKRDRLKTALEIYAVESIGQPKSLPIQEHGDFPGLGPCECQIVEVTLKYPTVTDQLEQIVAEKLGMSRKAVRVRTLREEENTAIFYEPKKAKDGSVLNNPDLESDDTAQSLVGEKRKDSLLKELVSRKYEFAAEEKTAKEDAMQVSAVSPVGSKQNKIPDPTNKGK